MYWWPLWGLSIMLLCTLQMTQVNPLCFLRNCSDLKKKWETKASTVVLGTELPMICMSLPLPPLIPGLHNSHLSPQECSISQTGNGQMGGLLNDNNTCELNICWSSQPLQLTVACLRTLKQLATCFSFFKGHYTFSIHEAQFSHHKKDVMRVISSWSLDFTFLSLEVRHIWYYIIL